mmetsp:Transcript_14901/g.30647  ORF Transcript_14901/g.30647 Transcript_14901/m.30647 type:complete len:135 (-) Transcript_14901:16-420(-)
MNSDEFQFVIVNSPTLASVRSVDQSSFSGHFSGNDGNSDVLTFPNIGGDSLLVVPSLSTDRKPEVYTHLASFVRGAPEAQVDAFFRTAGNAIREALQDKGSKRWVSTSGLGVYWVHLRVDKAPKYYQYAEFAAM